MSVYDVQGTERHRWIGYLPPEEFLPKAQFARAWLAMLAQDWNKASGVLNEIVSVHKHSLSAPDALYWFGVAKWKASRNFDDLSQAWTDLLEHYPRSEAADAINFEKRKFSTSLPLI